MNGKWEEMQLILLNISTWNNATLIYKSLDRFSAVSLCVLFSSISKNGTKYRILFVIHAHIIILSALKLNPSRPLRSIIALKFGINR